MSAHSGSTPAGSVPSPRLESVRSSSSAIEEKKPRNRAPRSLPPWIGSYEADPDDTHDDLLCLLHPPFPTVAPAHHGIPGEAQRRMSRDGWIDPMADPLAHRQRQSRVKLPHFISRRTSTERGRKWDHLRTAEPVIVASYLPPSSPQSPRTWGDFVHSSEYGRGSGRSMVVDPGVLEKLQPNFDNPVSMPPYVGGGPKKKGRSLIKHVARAVVQGSLSLPLFRFAIIVMSAVSLGLGCRLFMLGHHDPAPRPQPDDDDDDAAVAHVARVGSAQALFVVIVDVLAIPYIGYILWDEWSGKPLGLRSAMVKTGLILLDLFFIIFKSAGTALVFESIVLGDTTQYQRRQSVIVNPMAGFMLVGLIAWTITFVVNVFKTVERLGGGEEDGARGWV